MKAEKPCENCRYGSCQRKGEEPLHSAGKKETKCLRESPEMIHQVCCHQSRCWFSTRSWLVTSSSQVLSSCLQWCFHPFCMFPGQSSSACYLLKEMRPCSHAFPPPPVVPSDASISQKSLQVILTRICTTHFPNALNCLSTERQVITCYCYICLYYQKSIFKVLANAHIRSPVEHTIKRWPFLLRISRVKQIIW